jgi:hypothetical protein
MRIILENKEREVGLLQRRFPYDKNLIRKIFDLDPTLSGDYAGFISRTLPKYIVDYQGANGGLTKKQNDILFEKYFIVRWFHQNKKNLTPEIISKFIYVYGDNYPDIPDIKRESDKIGSYYNPDRLIDLKNIFEKKTDKETQKNIAKSQATVLMNTDDVLIVEPESFEAAKYYGNDHWYISCENCRNKFEAVKTYSKIVIFIDKNNPEGKILLVVDNKNKNRKIITDTLDVPEIRDLYNIFPSAYEIIDELIGRSNFLRDLKLYLSGEIDSKDIFFEEEGVEIKLKPTKNQNKELTWITIKFDDDSDYFKIFNLDDDDQNFINRIYSSYGTELYDSYYANEEFTEGRINFYFNEKNEQKFLEIIKIIAPEYVDDYNNGDQTEELFNRLEDMFERECRDIIYDYASYYNDALVDGNKEYIEESFGDIFFEYGIYKKSLFYSYVTSIGNFIELYEKIDSMGVESPYELLKDIASNSNPPSSLWDNYYEVDTFKFFDKEGFNRNVERNLDSILEKLEDLSISEELNFMKKLNQDILSIYKMNRDYPFPYDKEKTFTITNVLKQEQKIELIVKKGDNRQRIKVTIPEFFQLINTYPLFN